MYQIVAIDMLWGRYGYHELLMPLQTYLEVCEGDARYPMPLSQTCPHGPSPLMNACCPGSIDTLL
jgi:hypothetical protein